MCLYQWFGKETGMRVLKYMFFCGLLVLCTADALPAEPSEIGTRRELFVDDHVITELSGNAELRLHQPIPREVVLVHDEPWEGTVSSSHVVFRDGDIYRMYYRGWNF